VRVIAATNRDLSKEVHQGHFRSDLFYRLCVFPITVPALSKRVEDIPLLVSYFVDKESTKYNKKFDQISKADLQRLIEHPWPGNVRELKNLIERSVIISEGRTLRLEWFFDLQHENAGFNSLADVERQHILKVMESCQWKINGVNGAAEKLNMHPNTLRFKMKKLQITRPVKDMS
jgi:formate hydrogenlyase transcriptional activator